MCALCSIAKLKMLEEEGGKLVKVAHTMVAKDGEVKKIIKCFKDQLLSQLVPFLNHCFLTGQVEVWLNKLMDEMRETIR